MTPKLVICAAAALALGIGATPAAAGGKWRCCDNGATAYYAYPDYQAQYYAPSHGPYYTVPAYNYYPSYPSHYPTYPAYAAPSYHSYAYDCPRRVRRCCH